MNGLRTQLAGVNRYFLAVGIGVGSCLLGLVFSGFLWPSIVFATGWQTSLYQGMLTSVCFFGLVGFAVFVQQISASRGDTLRKRIEYMFASTGGVSGPLIEYVERVIKRNALYSTGTLHLVEIHEYHPQLRAYRATMENSYELRNVFGDLPLDESIPFNFVPDLMSSSLSPLAELASITTTSERGTVEHVDGRKAIPATGLQVVVRLRVQPMAGVQVRSEHWTWALNSENSGFAIRRFSERTRVLIRNRSSVTARVFRPENSGEVISLGYGEEVAIRDETRVPEMKRLDFSWLPPVEFPEPAEIPREGVHPLLTRRDDI